MKAKTNKIGEGKKTLLVWLIVLFCLVGIPAIIFWSIRLIGTAVETRRTKERYKTELSYEADKESLCNFFFGKNDNSCIVDIKMNDSNKYFKGLEAQNSLIQMMTGYMNDDLLIENPGEISDSVSHEVSISWGYSASISGTVSLDFKTSFYENSNMYKIDYYFWSTMESVPVEKQSFNYFSINENEKVKLFDAFDKLIIDSD